MKRLAVGLLALLLLPAMGMAEERLVEQMTIGGVAFSVDAPMPGKGLPEATEAVAPVRAWTEESLPDAALFFGEDEAVSSHLLGEGQVWRYWTGGMEDPERSLLVGGEVLFYTRYGETVHADGKVRPLMWKEGEEASDLRYQLALEVPAYHDPGMSEVPDLPGMPYAVALALAQTYLEALAIETGDPFYVEVWDEVLARRHVFWRDPEPLAAQVTAWEAEAKPFYSLHFPVMLSGMRAMTEARGNSPVAREKEVPGLEVHMVISADGLEYLRVWPMLGTTEAAGASRTLLTADEALEVLRDAPGSFFTQGEPYCPPDRAVTAENTIVRMAQEVLVIRDAYTDAPYELVPVWTFYVQVDKRMAYDGQVIQRTQSVTPFAIHAVTGERVL